MVGLLTAYGETAQLRSILGVKATPLLGRYLVVGAWWTVLGTLLILIGAAIFAGKTLGTTSTGSIIMMIGFFFWWLGQSHVLMVCLSTMSMAPLMPDMGLRYRAWHQSFAELGVFV